MRAFIVILLVAVSVHAQSLADVARKERERREHLKPAVVIKSEGTPPAAPAAGGAKGEEGKKPEEANADSAKPAEGTTPQDKAAAAEKPTDNAAASEKPKESAKPQAPAVDPTKEWNDQLQKLRAKIQSLLGEETATQLQINELNNQIFATVVDQATKDQALAQIGEAKQKLAAVRSELDQTRKTLELLQLQGPLKK
jgi:chromosome segregation ATPase